MSLLPHRTHASEHHDSGPQERPSRLEEGPPKDQPPDHHQQGDPPGSSPPRETPAGQPEPVHSPSETPGERDPNKPAPEANRPNPQAMAIQGGRDPGPNKHSDTGGCPGGSPGRQLELEPVGGGSGACAPEPAGAKDHRPGEFEQPSRWDAPRREHGDYAP